MCIIFPNQHQGLEQHSPSAAKISLQVSTLEEKKKNPLKDLLNFFLPLDARWETKSLSQLNNFYTRQCLAKVTETEIMISSKIPEENFETFILF